ncbi:MAG: lysophospholipase [Acidobacteriota bacterium]
MGSTIEMRTSRDGTAQLRRVWPAAEPRAALQLVHGIGEHSGRYEHAGDVFAALGIDVAAIDNRGCGESGGRRAHIDDFGTFLDDLEDQLSERRELGVPVILFGHSLGGLMTAAYLAQRRQPAPDLAILSAPALAPAAPPWQRIAAAVLGRLAPRLFIRVAIPPEVLSRDEAVQRAYVEDPLMVSGATAGLALQIFKTMKRTSAAYDRVELPLYVLHGEADRLVPIKASRPLAGRPNVTYRSWPNLRHECLNEPEREQVMAEISSWIDARLKALDAQA